MRLFLAHFLVVLAAWTVTIKYAFPIAMAVAEDAPLLGFVWWDFWWVAHLWLAWALIARPRHLLALMLVVAPVEVVIVVTKFVYFLAAPEWTIWTTNWFINKIFVLAVFVPMLVHVAFAPGEYRGPVTGRRGAAATADAPGG